MKARLIGAGVATLLFLALGAAIYLHYTSLLGQVEDLTAEKAKLGLALKVEQAAVASLREAVGSWKGAYETLVSRQGELEQQARVAGAEVRRLNDIFGSHDLARLAQAKPGLVERRVNNGTARALRLFECSTDPGGCGPARGGAPAERPLAAPPGPRADAPREVGRPDPGATPF